MVSSQTVGAETVSDAPVIKRTLDRAVPDDVKQVIRQWGAIRSDLPQPMKTYLKTAKLSLNEEDRLLIVVEDGVGSDYFLKQEESCLLPQAL